MAISKRHFSKVAKAVLVLALAWFSWLMLEITRHALEDAGYARRRLADGNVGVFVGASSSDHRMLIATAVNVPCDLAGRSGLAPELTAEVAAAVTAALPPIQAYSIVGQQLNMIAANDSHRTDESRILT